MATAKPTTDHDQIRKWVEARGGRPARVKATGRGKDPGILRIDFPGFSGEDTLEEIEWDEFFEWFDRNNLALVLSNARGNRFNKLVERSASRGASGGRASRSSGKKAAASKKSASSKKASAGRKSAAKKSSAKTASSAKKASSTKSSAKKASTSAKKSSAKKSSTKKSSAKKSSTKKASSAKKAPARSLLSRITGGAKKSSAKKSTSKKSTAKKSASKKSGASSKTTTNHDEIRQWVEARGGFPATVAGTESRGEEAGLLRIDYPGFSGKDTLERIDWDTWFEKFDSENLAFLYQDKKNSRFSKLVRR